MKRKGHCAFFAIAFFAVYLTAILSKYHFKELSRSIGDIRVQSLRNYNGEMPRPLSELAHLPTEEEAYKENLFPAF